MFVSKINGAQSFHKAVFSGNGQGAGTAAQPDLNKMSDSAKLDLLVKKMNTLQMDVLSKFPLNASNMIVSLCMISIDPSFFTVSMICFKDMANVVSLKLNIKLTVSKEWVS